MSHIEQVKTIQQATRAKVMLMLGWDDLQYGDFQFKQAEAYLEHHIGADVWGVQQIKETPGFWAWWRNHWHKRDMEFVYDAKALTPTERALFYEITHAVEAIEFTMHHSFAREVVGRLKDKGERVKV